MVHFVYEIKMFEKEKEENENMNKIRHFPQQNWEHNMLTLQRA
jgi:hypothetical protein